MKILILSISEPEKDGKGYEVLLYYRVKSLLQQGDAVTLFVLCSTVKNKKLSNNHEFFIDGNFTINYFPIGKAFTALNILKTVLFTKLPLQVGLYSDSKMYAEILRHDKSNSFNLIISNLIRPMKNIPADLKTPVILDVLDSMSLNFHRRFKQETNFIKKKILAFELKRLISFEANVPSDYSVFTVAQLDLESFKLENKFCLQLGVAETTSIKEKHSSFNRFVFAGNMNYAPNIDAFNWLRDELWPIIRKQYPDARLFIVGRGSKRLSKIDQTICLVGAVESMTGYLSGMDVAMAPMRQGSGMQFKVLEALSVGLPVVITQLGLGSIQAKKDEDVYLFSDPRNLLSAIDKIHKNGNRVQQRQEFIKKFHSWTSINNKFRDELLKISKLSVIGKSQ